MADLKYITHKDFAEGYKSGKLLVYVDKNKAGDFVMSPHADKHNKPAHLFWTWTGIILTIPLAIILIFINWKLAIPSFVLGFVVIKAARKSASQFVLNNMLENEEFWMYCLLHKGAKVTDDKENIYTPKEFKT